MAIAKLSESERQAALAQIPYWHHEPERDAICRRFEFTDFAQAFAFMTQVAVLAEAQDHHPEWSNVWNRVDILLTTHDADGLSKRDIDLALAIDALGAS
jgi:4a-hydroxytetrahydrobiopterin dehydratase